MSASKQKGYRAEVAIVKTLQAAGIEARRQPLSGSMNDFKGDVILPSGEKIEVKHRESIGDYYWSWLEQGDAKYLVIKKNGKPPLVLMEMPSWIELLQHTKGETK